MTLQSEVSNNPNYKKIHEYGFVGLIDHLGDDHSIARAARVSYGTGTKNVSDDRNLIRYLVRHKHTSPLEMGEVVFHIKLPIFVMRQLVRHRTASLNEYSGRYSEMSDEFYLPAENYMQPQSKTNKQGRAGEISEPIKKKITNLFLLLYEHAYSTYKTLLGDTPGRLELEEGEEYPGLSRELARLPLSVSNYTECFFKMDIHNLFHMLNLRMDSHAQREIRDFANAMYELVKPHFPLACEAFEDYIFKSVTLSKMDILALRDMLENKFQNSASAYGMSQREFVEFIELWQKPQNTSSH
jgi:thymidylate synthase (FAD)